MKWSTILMIWWLSYLPVYGKVDLNEAIVQGEINAPRNTLSRPSREVRKRGERIVIEGGSDVISQAPASATVLSEPTRSRRNPASIEQIKKNERQLLKEVDASR